MSKLNILRNTAFTLASALAITCLPSVAQESVNADSLESTVLNSPYEEMDLLVSLPESDEIMEFFEFTGGQLQSPILEIAPQAIAHRGAPGRPGFSPDGKCPVLPKSCGPMSCLSEENKLTDDQYEKMYQLKNKMLDETGPKKAELMSLKRKMKDVLTSESIDKKEADRLQKQIIALKSDLTAIKMSNMTEMAQILTAEQRNEIRKKMMKWSCSMKMRGMMGRGMMGGGMMRGGMMGSGMMMLRR